MTTDSRTSNNVPSTLRVGRAAFFAWLGVIAGCKQAVGSPPSEVPPQSPPPDLAPTMRVVDRFCSEKPTTHCEDFLDVPEGQLPPGWGGGEGMMVGPTSEGQG